MQKSLQQTISELFDGFTANNSKLISDYFYSKYPVGYFNHTTFIFPGGLIDHNRYIKERDEFIIRLIKDNLPKS